MYKRCLPLALALAWASNAYAFPPCEREPLELVPLDGSGAAPTNVPHWYTGLYGLVGNPLVIGGLTRWTADGDSVNSGKAPSNGKCHDRLPIPGDNAASGSVSLTPSYPDGAGFGVVALPDLRYNTTSDLRIRYTLAFSVDNQRLVEVGEWLDIAQLEFRWNEIDDHKDPAAVSAVYRIRKTQSEKDGLTIEVIEVRVPYVATGSRPPVFERVVATIPAAEDVSATPIALRWSQVTSTPQDGTESGEAISTGNIIIGPPSTTKNEVVSHLEVLGPTGGVLYGIPLHGQWANSLSMGLLNYNIGKESDYSGRYGAEMMGTSLCAEIVGTSHCVGQR
jgi:hypothetical protein